jgi:hypothetical protein
VKYGDVQKVYREIFVTGDDGGTREYQLPRGSAQCAGRANDAPRFPCRGPAPGPGGHDVRGVGVRHGVEVTDVSPKLYLVFVESVVDLPGATQVFVIGLEQVIRPDVGH